MEKIIIAIFDNEQSAYHGLQAIRKLDLEGLIAIHAAAVARKDKNGLTRVLEDEVKDFPVGTAAGTLVGATLGLLGGPVGFAIGISTGAFLGLISDAYSSNIDTELLGVAIEKLTLGKVAVVLDVNEDWTTPIDTEVEKLNGIVLRSSKIDVEQERDIRVREQKTQEIEALKKEKQAAKQERKEKIQAKIDSLQASLKQKDENFKKRMAEIHSQNQAKIEALKKKASDSHAKNKDAIKHFINEIEEANTRLERSVETSIGRKLKDTGEKLLSSWQ